MDEPEPIDFSWFYFIGRAKLKLTLKETGRLTLRMFGRLYKHYKNDFDLEMLLWKNNKTYSAAERETRAADEWL